MKFCSKILMNMKWWGKYEPYKFAIFAKSANCKICYFCHLQNPLSAKSIIFAICHIRQLGNFQNLPFAISAIRKNFQICHLQNPLTAKIFAKSTNRFICQPIFVKPCFTQLNTVHQTTKLELQILK